MVGQGGKFPGDGLGWLVGIKKQQLLGVGVQALQQGRAAQRREQALAHVERIGPQLFERRQAVQRGGGREGTPIQSRGKVAVRVGSQGESETHGANTIRQWASLMRVAIRYKWLKYPNDK